MESRRLGLAAGVALALLLLLAFLLFRRETPGRYDDPDRGAADQSSPDAGPALVGTGTVAARPEAPPVASDDSAQEDASQDSRLTEHEIEVLDYRNTAVAGVRVFVERDLYEHSGGARVRSWRVLAEGVSDEQGRVVLSVDRTLRTDARSQRDGLNHRIRVEPPKEREDLASTWRLWVPAARETYRFSQSHVVAGVVIDSTGEGIAGATVFIGSIPGGDVAIPKPQWRHVKAGPDGRFRFEAIPTTQDWKIDVWALRAGEDLPRSSREIRGSLRVTLDDRYVRIALK